jgi:hypothetical protein
MVDGSPAAEEDARNRMREILTNIAPEIVAQSDAEDEAAERALTEPEAEEPEPSSDQVAAATSPSNVKYLSTRAVDGKPPWHYLRREDNSDDGVICAKPWAPPGGWR